MSIAFVPGDRDRGLARGHAPAAALAAELSAAWSIPLAALLRRRPGSIASATCRGPSAARNVARRVLAARHSPGPRLPRRRRLHDRLDGDGVRDRTPSGGRPAGRSRVPGAGRAVVE